MLQPNNPSSLELVSSLEGQKSSLTSLIIMENKSLVSGSFNEIKVWNFLSLSIKNYSSSLIKPKSMKYIPLDLF
jgi:hypothetical protein